MTHIASALLRDECGFVVSAELVLVATIVVIGMIVGLSEVQHAVVAELNDVADAVGALNQSYTYSGMASYKSKHQVKGAVAGSAFKDVKDECDDNQCDLSCLAPTPEGPKH